MDWHIHVPALIDLQQVVKSKVKPLAPILTDLPSKFIRHYDGLLKAQSGPELSKARRNANMMM